MTDIKHVFSVGIIFILIAIQNSCTSFNAHGYSPLTNKKTRVSSVIGSFYDFKYEYYYLELSNGLVIDIHISKRGLKLDSIVVNFLLKNNSVFQLKTNEIVITSENMNDEYATNIEKINFQYRCDDGRYLRKLPLDLITFTDIEKCMANFKSVSPKYYTKIEVNIAEELDRFVLILPNIIVNGKEIKVKPITFIKKEFEEGLSGTL